MGYYLFLPRKKLFLLYIWIYIFTNSLMMHEHAMQYILRLFAFKYVPIYFKVKTTFQQMQPLPTLLKYKKRGLFR